MIINIGYSQHVRFRRPCRSSVPKFLKPIHNSIDRVLFRKAVSYQIENLHSVRHIQQQSQEESVLAAGNLPPPLNKVLLSAHLLDDR